MNQIVDPIRGLVRDLVERRLWPIAVALLVALVAIPVLLGGGSDAPEPTDPTAAAAAVPAPEKPSVVLADEAQGPETRKGKLTDPFYDPPEEKVAAADTGVQDTAEPPAAPGAGAGGGTSVPTPDAGPTTPSVPDTTPDTTKPKAKKPVSIYDENVKVNLRFGQTGAVKNLRGVAPYTPLPSLNDPFFVFEGVLRGTNTARFLVSEKVKATGDGKCRPNPKSCQTIDLEPGDSQYFDLTTADGRSIQFQLDYFSKTRLTGTEKITLVKRSSYTSRVRFGAASQVMTRTLPRLAPLGTASDPVAQYLGVSSDRGGAVFVLAPGSRLESKEFCLDGGACRTFVLKRGGVAVVSHGGRNHGIRVLSIERRTAKTAKLGRLARHSASDAGRALLRRLLADGPTAHSIGGLRYSAVAGTISRINP